MAAGAAEVGSYILYFRDSHLRSRQMPASWSGSQPLDLVPQRHASQKVLLLRLRLQIAMIGFSQLAVVVHSPGTKGLPLKLSRHPTLYHQVVRKMTSGPAGRNDQTCDPCRRRICYPQVARYHLFAASGLGDPEPGQNFAQAAEHQALWLGLTVAAASHYSPTFSLWHPWSSLILPRFDSHSPCSYHRSQGQNARNLHGR